MGNMVDGVILAAGYSSRMGQDKLLLSYQGKPILEHIINTALESELNKVVLVYRTEEIKKIGQKYDLTLVYNPEAQEGQSSSVKRGVINASDKASGYMFLVGDQPFLTSQLIDRMIDEFWRTSFLIVAPLYGEEKTRGTPVLFSQKLRPELLEVSGDKGGRELINKYSEEMSELIVENEKVGLDLDTWEEYQYYT